MQVALQKGLISSSTQFNPSGTFSRAELARGVAAIIQMNVEE